MSSPDTQESRETREAYERAEKPTHPPICEDERIVTREREEALRRPFPWLMLGTAVVLTGLAVFAALRVGGQFAIPFALIAVVIGVFVGTHRVLGRLRTDRYDTGRAQESAPSDSGDPVPHLGFDEESQLGSTAELSDEQQQSHAQMEPGTGTR